MTGFVYQRCWPVGDEQKATNRCSLGSDLVSNCPGWRGREKLYYLMFGHDAVLLIENFIKKRRENEIMQCLDVALCRTCRDKEAKQNRDERERTACKSVSSFPEALSFWPFTRLPWVKKAKKADHSSIRWTPRQEA